MFEMMLRRVLAFFLSAFLTVINISPAASQEKELETNHQAVSLTIAGLIDRASSGESLDRCIAIGELLLMGEEAASAVPVLLACLKDDNTSVRWEAVVALGSIAPSNPAVIESLLDLLSEPERGIRIQCLKSLALARVCRDEIMNKVAPFRSSSDQPIRLCAEYVWLRLLPDEREEEFALSPIIEASKSENASIRQQAAGIMGALAPRSQSTIPLLITMLSDNDYGVATAAASSLGEFGALAKTALPRMHELYESADEIEKRMGYFRNNKLTIAIAIGAIVEASGS